MWPGPRRLINTAAFFDSRSAALPMRVLIGAIGGLLVVLINVLLQHRRQSLLTAGRSIAVQNFNQTFSILVLLASYAGLLWLGLAIMAMMVLLGLTTSALVGLRAIFGFAPLPIVSVAHGCDDPSWDGP